MKVYIVKTLGIPTVILGVFDDENLANSFATIQKKYNHNVLMQDQKIVLEVRELISMGSPEANEILLS